MGKCVTNSFLGFARGPKNSSGDGRSMRGGISAGGAARRIPDSLGETSPAAASAADRAGSRMPGQPGRSAHRLGARQVPRQPWDRTWAGISRPRLNRGTARGEAGSSVRRALGRRESLLVREAKLSGAVLIRGRRLDGPQRLGFNGHSQPARELRIEPWNSVSWEGQPPKSRGRPSDMRVRASGCYGVQIDGTTFSRVVVIAVDVS
jgi:hypothetical protein